MKIIKLNNIKLHKKVHCVEISHYISFLERKYLKKSVGRFVVLCTPVLRFVKSTVFCFRGLVNISVEYSDIGLQILSKIIHNNFIQL